MINRELIQMFFKRHLLISLIVGLCAGVISFFLAIIFPETNMQNAELISSSWPQIMKDLFGDPIYAFTNVYGWLYLQVYHITFWLIFGVLASILASYIVAKEIEDKTIDILLSTPVSRKEVILNRFIGIFMLLFISIIPTIAGSVLGIIMLNYSVNLGTLFSVSIIGFLLSLNFAVITLFVSICIPRQIFSIFISLSILGFMFLYEESLAAVIPFLDKFSFLSVFHYYRPENILIHHTDSVLDVIIMSSICIVIMCGSLLSFSKRDILI